MRGGPEAAPKPLMPVGGIPLLGRTLGDLRAAGVREFVVILNESDAAAGGSYLRATFRNEKVTILVRSTRSSFESLTEVLKTEPARRFVVSVVDSVYPAGALRGFLEFASGLEEGDVALGLTDYIEDEKPLYADLDSAGRIRALGGAPSPWVTCGAYFLGGALVEGTSPSSFPSLRSFLGGLVQRNLPVYGFPMGKVIDVDRPEDLLEAEALVGSRPGTRNSTP